METKYKTALIVAGNENCNVYSSSQYNHYITLEDNMRNAIRTLQYARELNGPGPKLAYLQYAEEQFAKASDLIKNAERV